MKKRTLLLISALLLGATGAWAQAVASYTLETDNAPWVSIASTGTQLTSVVGDGGFQSIAMPFDFDFGEATIAQGSTVYLRADGYMILANNTGTHHAYQYCNGSTPVIVPFLLVDGQMPSGTSGCYWQVDTAADGQRVLVVEFRRVQHYNGSTDNFNYQLRLYENGNVSVHYGRMENHHSDTSFNFMMVATPVGGYGDAVALSGTWSDPSAFHPYTMGSNALSVQHYITGMPDSGMVFTYVRPEPPCPHPRNIRVESLTPTQAVLAWTPNGVGGCTYLLLFDTVYFSSVYPGSRTPRSTNDSVYYFDTLLPNHHYYGYVKSDCGADNSSWQPFDFWTPCYSIGRADLPFAEDFNSYTDYTTYSNIFQPGCWRRSETTNGVSLQSGQRCLRLTSGTVALPPIDSLAGLEVSFSSYCQSGTMEFGILENPGDYASFLPLSTITPTNAWTTFVVRTGAYSGEGKAVAFRVNGVWFIDDVDVHVAVGCPAVDTVTVDSVGSTTARVSWDDINNTGSYRVVYRPLASAAADTLFATASPATLTGLTPDVEYLVLVYALCSDGPSEAASANFHTRCLPMTAPFVESFEHYNPLSCWTTAGLRFNTINHVADGLPELSSEAATNGQNSLRLYSRYTNYVGREVSWAVLPVIEDSVRSLTLEFDYRLRESYGNVELAVGITTTEDDTSGFRRLLTIRPTDSLWHRYHVDFALYTGPQGRVALMQGDYDSRTYTSMSSADYGFVDSVVVAPMPSCARPVALRVTAASSTTASFSWTDVNGVGTYEVSCNGQSVTVSGDTVCTVNGLSPATTYSVSVRTVCPDGLTSAISTSFSTSCTPVATVPWSENFDSWPNDGFDDCWYRVANESGQSCRAATMFHRSGSQGLWLRCVASSYDHTNNPTVVALPEFAQPLSNLAIGFYVYDASGCLELGVLPYAGDTNTFVLVDTVAPGTGNWWYYEHDLGTYTGPEGRLALRYSCPGASSRFTTIDDIIVVRSSSCPRPQALLIDSVGLDLIRMAFVGDSAATYRLWWGEGTTLTDSVDFADSSYTLAGLQHSTSYSLAVATLCPADSSISTAVEATVSTLCGVVTHADMPYEEHFDNGIGLCSNFLDYCYPGNSGDRTNGSTYRGPAGKALCPNVGYNSEPFFYVLPEVDSLGGLAMHFWSRDTYSQDNKVTVGVMDNLTDTTTFVPIQTVYPTTAQQWAEYYVPLGSYSGSGRHPALRFGVRGTERSNTRFIDDIELVHDLSCTAPDSVSVAAVTDSSALLVVHDPRGVGHYRLYALGDTIDFTGDSVEVTGLGIATDYALRVASVCEEGIATFPVEVRFTTDCGAYPLPYSEDFEACQVNRMARCWEVKDSATYSPSVRSVAYATNGQQTLFGSLTWSDSIVTLVSPQMHFADTDAYVSFMAMAVQSYRDSAFVAHFLPMRVRVTYLDDTMDSALTLFDDSIASSVESYGTADYNWHTIDLATTEIPLGDGRFYFSFFRDSLATSAAFALDSVTVITIHHAPPCRPVASVQVDSVTLATARVSWVPQGPATEWEVWLGSRYGDTTLTATVPEATFTDLEQGTEYSLVVRPLCDDGQWLWSDTLTFSTRECPPVEDVTVVATASHSVEVAWQAPTAGPWRVQYGPADFARGLGTDVTIEAQAPGRVTARIEGLSASTIYDLYVMTLCDEAKQSVWSSVVRFTTEVEGIDGEPGMGRLLLVPNPASDMVEVVGMEPGAAVTVRDATGRIVPVGRRGASTLDVGQLPQGVYYVTVATGAATATTKLVVLGAR